MPKEAKWLAKAPVPLKECPQCGHSFRAVLRGVRCSEIGVLGRLSGEQSVPSGRYFPYWVGPYPNRENIFNLNTICTNGRGVECAR